MCYKFVDTCTDVFFLGACTNKTLMKLFRKNVGHQAIGLINEYAGARDDNRDVALEDIRSGEMPHRKSGALDCANHRRRCFLAGDADKCSMDICTMLVDEIVSTADTFYRSCVAVSKTSRIIIDMGGTGTEFPVETHHHYRGAFFEIAPRANGGKLLYVSLQMAIILKLDIETLQRHTSAWYSHVIPMDEGLRFVLENDGLTGRGCFALIHQMLLHMVHTVRLEKGDPDYPRGLWVGPLRLWLSGIEEAQSFSQLMQIASEVQTRFVHAMAGVSIPDNYGYELVSVYAKDPENATENRYSRGLLFEFGRREAAEISQRDTRDRPRLHYHPYKHPNWTGEVIRYRGAKEYRRNKKSRSRLGSNEPKTSRVAGWRHS